MTVLELQPNHHEQRPTNTQALACADQQHPKGSGVRSHCAITRYFRLVMKLKTVLSPAGTLA
jgi:hypothetical protein